MGAYRNDLAAVVRQAAAPDTNAPADTTRPAPLVLVSEQRIDRPGFVQDGPGTPVPDAPMVSVQPVRPRRPAPPMVPAVIPSETHALPGDDDIALALADAFEEDLEEDDGPHNIFDADSGFPEFAERLGATDLPDLLEAAAAYIACVEKLDSFTRPQLMRHIGAATEGLSREDGLRTFGTLLRDGVIERSRRGQFALNEASPILAEARKIAG